MKYLKNVRLDFRDLPDDENLYDDVDLTADDVVEAQYWKYHGYLDNPDVCALPRPASMAEIKAQNSVPLAGYDDAKARIMSVGDKKRSLLRLKEIRLPFPFHSNVDTFLNAVLVSAYASRRLAITDRPVEYAIGSSLQQSNIVTAGKDISSNTLGFSVIGTSGSGKSTAFQMTSAKYPRAIRHCLDTISYVQIPIVRLTAFANGNLKALYYMFASQLDEILDSGDLHYRQMRGGTDLGRMTTVVEDWIKRYHIGVIAIDEIQLMDFNANSAKSMENLLTVTAMTGVALVVIGTQDACSCWGRVLRLQRRTESLSVRADEYCRQREYVEMIIKRIWKYQWTSKKAELTDSILKAMYDESLGSIDLLTSLWMMIQFEAISSKVEPEIDENYVHKIAKGRYERMKCLLSESLIESEGRYLDEKESVLRQIRMSAEADEQQRQMDAMRAETERNIRDHYDHDFALGGVLDSISCCCPEYSDAMIRRAFAKAEATDGFTRLSKKDKTGRVLEILKEKKDRKKKASAAKHASEDKVSGDRIAKLEKELQASMGMEAGMC